MFDTFRFALRSLKSRPAFTAIAIGMLALGIGGTTAMFSVTETLLLKPLNFRNPNQLYTVLLQIPKMAQRYPTIPINAWHYRVWRERSRTIESIAAVGGAEATLSGSGDPEHVEGVRASANLFALLGVQARIGRTFLPEEGEPGTNRVALLSDQFWRRKFSANPGVLGQKILLDGAPYQVIGVLPANFPFPRGKEICDVAPLPADPDYWTPLVFNDKESQSALSNMNYSGIARLKPGAGQSAVEELNALEREIAKSFPEPLEVKPVIRPLREALTGNVRRPLLLLLAAVGLVLLIVCINLMDLMLIRVAGRKRELAIRVALGAGGSRLIRQLLAESLTIAITGGVLGVLLSAWLLSAIKARSPFNLPLLEQVRLDPLVLLFALFVSVASAVLFGLWPALKAASAAPLDGLQAAGRSNTGDAGSRRTGNVLVAVEVALSLVLLLNAGLLLRSMGRILQIDEGFDDHNVMAADVKLPPSKYRERAEVGGFYRRALDGARAMPDVRAAGLISALPGTTEMDVNPVSAGDRAAPTLIEWPITNYRAASPDYFAAAGIPLRAGRIFSESDGAQPVAVISDNLAERLWPGQDPIGRPLRFYGDDRAPRVIGVVGAIHVASLTKGPGTTVYLPFWQEPHANMSLIIKTVHDPGAASAGLRRVVWGIDNQVPIAAIRTMRSVVSDSLAMRRFETLLLAAFAVVALMLTCLGIYGVLSYAISKRTNEIGVRIALGACPSQVRGKVLFEGMAPVLVGLALGLAGSVAVGTLIRALLFDIRPLDPFTYLGATVLLIAVALSACFIPAHRASRLNPLMALRPEG